MRKLLKILSTDNNISNRDCCRSEKNSKKITQNQLFKNGSHWKILYFILS